MGSYEKELMKELDALDKRLEKKDQKRRGREPSGEGTYITRSGCCEEHYKEEW